MEEETIGEIQDNQSGGIVEKFNAMR